MKADVLKALLDARQWKPSARSFERPGEMVCAIRNQVLSMCRAELAALEAELAAMRRALLAYTEAYPHDAPGDCFATGPMTGNPILDLVVCPGCVAKDLAERALTPDSGKVLVDVEKLREIEHSGDMFCPSCGGGYPLHADDCWIDAVLKDRP